MMLKVTALAPTALEALQTTVLSETSLNLSVLWTPSSVCFCVAVFRTWQKDARSKAKKKQKYQCILKP